MEINIKTNKIKILPSTIEYLNKKINSLKRILNSFKGEKSIFVKMAQVENKLFQVEIKLNLTKKSIIGRAKEKKLNAALDKAKDNLKRQLREIKEKESSS